MTNHTVPNSIKNFNILHYVVGNAQRFFIYYNGVQGISTAGFNLFPPNKRGEGALMRKKHSIFQT